MCQSNDVLKARHNIARVMLVWNNVLSMYQSVANLAIRI